MNFETLFNWCWIIPALVGIISGILGYLIGRGARTPDLSSKVTSLESDKTKLQADLDACNRKLKAPAPVAAAPIKKKAVSTSNSLAASAAPVAASFDAGAAKTAFGKKIKQDDLKIVEGIGPKIEGLFHNFGIKTWKALSEAPQSKCQEVLNSGGERYRIHDPGSWPLQAKMAYKGEWKKLAKWQDEHKGGKL